MSFLFGYALLHLVDCNPDGYNCDSKLVNNQIYSSLSDCEWERQRQAAYYDKSTLVCEKVARKSSWDNWSGTSGLGG